MTAGDRNQKHSVSRELRTAVVTGATGMIGATLVRRLLREGVRVFAVIRPGSKKRKNLPEAVEGLIVIERDLSELGELALPGKADAFFHFAWEGTYGEGRNDRILQDGNVRCTLDALALAKRLGARVFVGAGSQAEYGRTEDVLTPETPCRPETEYGRAKLEACRQGRALADRLGIDFIWTRVVSVYGPYDNGYTLISSAIRSLRETGTFAATQGEQIWNYLYSEDAAEWFFRLAKYGKNGEVYVLAGTKERPLREFLSELQMIVSPDGKIAFGAVPYRPEQVMRLTADVGRTVKDTGYLPGTSFREGIRKTVDWIGRE